MNDRFSIEASCEIGDNPMSVHGVSAWCQLAYSIIEVTLYLMLPIKPHLRIGFILAMLHPVEQVFFGTARTSRRQMAAERANRTSPL